MPRKKSLKLIKQCDAPAYVGVALNTLKKYVKRGFLPAPMQQPGESAKFWLQSDLDQLKLNLDKIKGRTGDEAAKSLGVTPVPQPVVFHAPTDIVEDYEPETSGGPPIATSPTVEAGLAVAAGVPGKFSQAQAEVLLREQIYEMSRRNKIVKRLFEHALSDSPTVSLAAIKEILSRIVPTLKTNQIIKGESEEQAHKSERTLRALEIIAQRMQRMPGSPSRTIPVTHADYRVIEE
jgi:hypothetical protein